MRAGIYCRLSEEDKNKASEQDDSESIQNQKSMLTEYAGERQWEIYDIYSDDNYAGADRNRPDFNRLLTDAREHKFDIILCKSQSRFTREVEIVEKYIHGLFPLWNIRFVSVVDNGDTQVKGNKKSRQINALINEWYLEEMSENIKSVLTSKRKNGCHIGSFALYGYKKDPLRKGHLIIDEEAARVVREVFALYSRGWGRTAIARHLNEKGIPNPTEYKRLQGLRYRQPESGISTLWKYYTVSDMLRNETYIGNLVQGRYASVSYKTRKNKPVAKEQWIRVEGTHEPVIRQEVWDTVQIMLKEKAKPFGNGAIGLFTGKVRCMGCGYALVSSVSRGRYYLKCPTRQISPEACPGTFLSVELLEKALLKEFRGMAEVYIDKKELEKRIHLYDYLGETLLAYEKKQVFYKKKQTEAAAALKQLYLDKVTGVITLSEYLEYTGEFRQEKEHMELLCTQAEERLEELRHSEEPVKSIEQTAGEYRKLPFLDRLLVEKFVEHIYIGREDPESGGVPVEIHWNF